MIEKKISKTHRALVRTRRLMRNPGRFFSLPSLVRRGFVDVFFAACRDRFENSLDPNLRIAINGFFVMGRRFNKSGLFKAVGTLTVYTLVREWTVWC